MKQVFAAMMALLLFLPVRDVAAAKAKPAVVEEGKTVEFDYTLIVDGEVVDSSIGRTPISYVHGKGGILPALEKELGGMQVDEEKLVIVPPEEAYGPVQRDAVKQFPRSALPSETELKEDMLITVRDQKGQRAVARVEELSNDTVTLDFNHPLAGKTLNFQVKIISVK